MKKKNVGTEDFHVLRTLFFFTEHNSATCEFMTANLSCPNETFININDVFYGRNQGSYNICNGSDGPFNGSCLPSSDLAGHNSAQVYERCQMRRNCTVIVSNDTFLDPCPGVNKLLKIQYSCSPGKELPFYNRHGYLHRGKCYFPWSEKCRDKSFLGFPIP